MRKIRFAAVGLAGIAALSACGPSGAPASGPSQQRTVTVLAAASLTESFNELAAKFSAQHPDVRIVFDFEGSQTLDQQINQGRKADVFASADTESMDKVSGAVVGKPATFATNRLTIAVPPGNPVHIRSLADLAAPGHKVVVCAPKVPCGAASAKVEQISGVRLQPVSEENDVKSVLQKVSAGEADAGLVYVTDAKSAGAKVQAVDFPESQQAINSDPIAALKDAPEPQLATEFVSFVTGPTGRQVLQEHGFGAP
jgi:molybdate transport system substrate-binding protein